MTDALSHFSAPVRDWFRATFSAPTAAQEGAWENIRNGNNTLIIAPTGSGKTLAAFLWALDALHREHEAGTAGGTRILYISPLKALGADVERNLRAPLAGITRLSGNDTGEPSITVGVRSGDTPARERRQLISNPPDILITTPESLYLMLTSAARNTLAGVTTVIVDEIHNLAATKRGAHLAVSLERLDALLEKPAQRIGLSATVENPEAVARFLGGIQPVTIMSRPVAKEWDLRLSVPVPNMAALRGGTHTAARPIRICALGGAGRRGLNFCRLGAGRGTACPQRSEYPGKRALHAGRCHWRIPRAGNWSRNRTRNRTGKPGATGQ